MNVSLRPEPSLRRAEDFGDEEEAIQRGTDGWSAEASLGGCSSGRGNPEGGDQRTDALPLEPERRRRCAYAKSAEVQTWCPESTLLRQRERMYIASYGPMGIPERSVCPGIFYQK